MHCFFRILAMVLFLSVGGSLLFACPFCRPVKTTFTEDINAADVAVLGELVARPKRPDSSEGELPAADIIDSYKTTFRIKKIYKGSITFQYEKFNYINNYFNYYICIL